MSKNQRPLLFATFILSCLALILLLVALATPNWVQSSPAFIESSDIPSSEVNYGLFQGVLSKPYPLDLTQFSIKISCLFSHNICALSCLKSAEERNSEVEALYNGDKPAFKCSIMNSSPQNNLKASVQRIRRSTNENKRVFINAGLWITTILFLSIGILLTVICCIFSIWNTVSNPVESFASIFMLYIWNGLTSAIDLITMLLWGIHFATNISENIAIRDTLVGECTSDGLSKLGFSYWLIFPAILIHLINIGLLYRRQYLINQEGLTVKTPSAHQTDGTIFLY